MKPARQKATGKRSRSANPTADDDDPHSDDDIRADDATARPAQAERKRELERNRRNLVNVRFLELEAEIRRCAPRVDSPTTSAKSEPSAKCRRIDKEAVLKEAAQRLAVQRKEMLSFADRLSNMTTEIDNLRAEKVELRSDKAYLRDELDTVRANLQRLRSDNIQLWQALKKQASVKNVLAPDVAKLPADLFLRPKNHEQPSLVPASGTVVVGHSGGTSGALSRQHGGYQSPSLATLAPGHQDAQQNNPTHPARNLNGDAYLVFQSPEELGELFTSYVPGSVTGFDRLATAVPTNPSDHRHSSNETMANVMSLGLTALANVSGAQSGSEYDPQQPQPNSAAKPPDIATSGQAQSNSTTDKQDEDPFSDVAYCV